MPHEILQDLARVPPHPPSPTLPSHSLSPQSHALSDPWPIAHSTQRYSTASTSASPKSAPPLLGRRVPGMLAAWARRCGRRCSRPLTVHSLPSLPTSRSCHTLLLPVGASCMRTCTHTPGRARAPGKEALSPQALIAGLSGGREFPEKWAHSIPPWPSPRGSAGVENGATARWNPRTAHADSVHIPRCVRISSRDVGPRKRHVTWVLAPQASHGPPPPLLSLRLSVSSIRRLRRLQ